MNPKAEEFVLDVRRAANLELKPTVTTDSQLIDPETAASALGRAAIWLTPKVVEAYDPAAFRSWPDELQTGLGRAVEGFRAVSATVPPDKPATASQFREGVRIFGELKEAVRKIVWADWKTEADRLIAHVEVWAGEFGWKTRQEAKKLNEMLIGEYTLDQLYMYAEGNLYVLDPIARFIPGGLGLFDLSIQPSFYITSIYRHLDDTWFIHLDVGQGVQGAKKEPLSADALKRAIVELRSLL